MSESEGGAMPPILSANRVSKSFGEIPVLFSIDFDVRPGEVHAIIGENGAGKSTLMKILSGFEQPTTGTITYDGKAVTLPPNGRAEGMGIVLIHQELNLAEHLKVVDSIFLGREIKSFGFMDVRQMREKAQTLLDTLHVKIDPNARIETLTVADKQMVEIAKAISRDARVLIMDEPTAVLSLAETQTLFEQIKRLTERGVAIIFISHKLDEVMRIANRVTVLRDGQLIATVDASALTPDSAAQMMVGRELSNLYPPKHEPDVDAPKVLSVRNLSAPGIHDVSFELRKGEILGFAGLVGSGRTAVAEAVIGLTPRANGEIELNGRTVHFANVAQSVAAGLSYMTKDRKGKGLLVNMGLRPNLTLLTLNHHLRAGFLDPASEARALERAVRRFDIRARDASVLVRQLSGGNQQKLMLGKTMETEPEIIIMDEPTRGIDVGTKQQIYHIIAALAAEGKSIILISSELQEVIGLSHRVVVMRAGRVVGQLEGTQINEEQIVRYQMGIAGDQGSMSNVAAAATSPAPRRSRFRLGVLGPLLALLLLMILGALLNGNFLSIANLSNIVARSSFIGLIAIGATFVITSGGLDLSVGSMAAFIAGMMIIIINSLVPSLGGGWGAVGIGIAAGLAIGSAGGATNGLLVTVGRIEPFIVTLGTLGIFRALITFLANGGTLNLNMGASDTYSPLYSGKIFDIPVPIIIFAIVAIIAEVVMRRTSFGRHIAAIGSNEQVARYSAIKVDRVRLLTYVLQGALVGLAAVLYVPKFGSANSSTAVLWELQAIAAVIIGGTTLRGGFGRIWGTVVGVIILELIGNILNLQSFISPYLNQAFQGAIIIVAVLLQRSRRTTN